MPAAVVVRGRFDARIPSPTGAACPLLNLRAFHPEVPGRARRHLPGETTQWSLALADDTYRCVAVGHPIESGTFRVTGRPPDITGIPGKPIYCGPARGKPKVRSR